MITLTSGSTTVVLYEGLQWVDEFAWQPVAMAVEHSTDGALLVDQALRLAGRPITLETPTQAAWAMTREQVQVLAAWASRAGEVLTLRLRGRDFSVMFDHSGGVGFEARPMRDWFDGDVVPESEYRVTMRFVEI